MFSEAFYPTPKGVFDQMTEDINFQEKTVYEPQAGKGDMVGYLLSRGANVICSEIHPDLAKIVSTICPMIAADCLTVTSDMIPHVDFIVMNPPFDQAAKHITHMFEIAPPGCRIISLCNQSNLKNAYSKEKKQLGSLIENYGRAENLGPCFTTAERYTTAEIALINLFKPGENRDTEFEGFFIEDETEVQDNGIMKYNVIRDIVNRYVAAVKLFDQQLEVGVRMNDLIGNITVSRSYDDPEKILAFTATANGLPLQRNEFKAGLQKKCWLHLFEKMNLDKLVTKGLKEDVTKFINHQTEIPFTMRNVYRMLEIVVGTAEQRMDKALLEVFEKLTLYYDDNRYHVEGWKTNAHYLVNRRFIMPSMVGYSSSEYVYASWGSSNQELIDDLVKALCFLSGKNYYDFQSFYSRISEPVLVVNKYTKETVKHGTGKPHDFSDLSEFEKGKWVITYDNDQINKDHLEPLDQGKPKYGKWFEWSFFRCRCYKKGTVHFEFIDQHLWSAFNTRIAKMKGYPLFEGKEQTDFQKRQTGRPVSKKDKKVA